MEYHEIAAKKRKKKQRGQPEPEMEWATDSHRLTQIWESPRESFRNC
jgi:hypothetical protein